jgi:hypothetical protein
MTFGGEQQVGEPAEHMWPDRLTLIGAGHNRDVGVYAEVIRPEPHQALDEANVCRDGGVIVRLGLAEKVLPHGRFGLGDRRRGGRRLCFHRLRHFGIRILHRCVFGDEFRGLLSCCHLTSRRESLLGQARGIELERDTISGAAAQ